MTPLHVLQMTATLNKLSCPLNRLNRTTCNRSKPFSNLRALRQHIRDAHQGETVPAFGVARKFIKVHNQAQTQMEPVNKEINSPSSENDPTSSSKSMNVLSQEYIDDDVYDYGDNNDDNNFLGNQVLVEG